MTRNNKDKKHVFRELLEDRAPLALEGMVEEYRFYSERKWRADYGWPDLKLLCEIDGGSWAPHGGRHATDRDREKINTAVSLGFAVLRFSPEQVTGDFDKTLEVFLNTYHLCVIRSSQMRGIVVPRIKVEL
jgi:very-short-patch-repair endonuclease